MTGTHAAEAVAQTRRWLEHFVIGLNLCPFAAAPYRGERVAYAVSGDGTLEGVYQAFLECLHALVMADPGEQETALLIVPDGLARFDDYLDTLAVLEEALTSAGLEGVIQLASFHPDYLFEGAAEDDPANFTNRSPFPMFHLIREDGLEAALASYPEPERIPKRNIDRLRALGLSRLRKRIGTSGEGEGG